MAGADLVVSAGGTMNREAVVLGTPVYTTFAGRLGGVDEQLLRDGRLRRLEPRRRRPHRAQAVAAAARGRRDPADWLRLAFAGWDPPTAGAAPPPAKRRPGAGPGPLPIIAAYGVLDLAPAGQRLIDAGLSRSPGTRPSSSASRSSVWAEKIRDEGLWRVVLIKVVVFVALGLYSRWWRYVSLRDLFHVVRACIAASVLVVLALELFPDVDALPRGVIASTSSSRCSR